jgi:hypothetical protein
MEFPMVGTLYSSISPHLGSFMGESNDVITSSRLLNVQISGHSMNHYVLIVTSTPADGAFLVYR